MPACPRFRTRGRNDSLRRGAAVLAEARLHQLRRADRANRDHAPGAGRAPQVDLRGRFLHALNYCMLLPGPEAQQLATYIGWLMHRTWGGIAAGGLFVLPSVFIMIALSWIYLAYGDVPLVAGVFYGIKPAVVAIVLAAAHRIGSRTPKNAWLWASAAAPVTALFAFHAPVPAILLPAG